MYSEEDLRNAYRWGTTVNHGTTDHFNDWFEQFKKSNMKDILKDIIVILWALVMSLLLTGIFN